MCQTACRFTTGATTFSNDFLQFSIIQHRIRQKTFQAAVFIFQRLQPLCLGYLKATATGLPFVEGRVIDPGLAAKIRGL